MFGKTTALSDVVTEKAFIVTTQPPDDTDEVRLRLFNQVIEELRKQEKVDVIVLDPEGHS